METQPSHRRRQSTLVFSTTKFDGCLAPDSRTGALGVAQGALDSPPSSLAQNQSLKPPSTPTNNSNRNSFGFWGGSKSAASTPNLGNTHRGATNEFSSSSMTTASASATLTRTQGSGEGSGASMDSSSSSFQQRRKRSESIGGIKNTAGNITRIVKKSSSNFLKKFVKNFDDRDAPPTPVIPASNNTSSIKSLPRATRSTMMPQLHTLSSPEYTEARIGPLDTPPPLSPLMGQELAHHFSSMESLSPVASHQHQTAQNSNIESWLRGTDSRRVASPSDQAGFSTTELAASLALLSREAMVMNRRLSKASDVADEDGEEDEEDEDEDEDMPINISNRLSKLYESGSVHLNHSQTSLYYSTKSNLSDGEAAEIASRRASLAQDALGYSLGLSRGNSIRFSQYSIGSLHVVPMQSLTTSTSTPSSPGLLRGLVDSQEHRTTPRRPVSLFIPLSTSAAIEDGDKTGEEDKNDDKDHLENFGADTDADTTPTNLSVAGTASSSSTPPRATVGTKAATLRPITICVSPEDANKIPKVSSSSTTTFLTPDMSPEDQREATSVLALRTSKRCFDEDVTFLKRDEISEYLGTPKPFQKLVLTHYMDHFDFAGKRLDVAFRALCQRLILKGETQEVDRILEAFAQRYVVCNPRTLLGGADYAKDVVHAITYSVLLLNTDLHIVQQSSKMSRSAFVKNTLQVVQSQASQASQDQSSPDDSTSMTGASSSLGLPRSFTGESLTEGGLPMGSKKRTPSVKSWKSGQSQQSTSGFGQVLSGHHHSHSGKMGTDAKANGGHGNGKWWHQELESLLKDIYTAVKQNQILLPTSPPMRTTPRSKSNASLSSPPTSPTTSGFGSSIFSSNRMSRLIYPSSSSSSLPYQQDSGGGFGLGLSGRRSSVSARTKQLRNDAIQRLNAAQAQSQSQSPSGVDTDHLLVSALSSTSSNLNVRHSVAGSMFAEFNVPDGSSDANYGVRDRDQNKGPVCSRDLSFLRTGGDQSQHSSTSLHSNMTMATSQTAISTSTSMTTPSASQNSLASLQSHAASLPAGLDDQQQLHKKHHPHQSNILPLAHQQSHVQGQREQLHQQHIQARYRMEGIMWRKHLLERSDKKAQHRAWRQLLVVVDTDQGTLSMFRSDGTLPKPPLPSYGQHQTLSTSSPSPAGEYEADVQLFDEIPLQHTITNILPPPGYSSSRRHVFAVQLFTGAVYLFQASSPAECEAWARTCNYWAARTSKEPLVGGIVNMEYGWGRALEAQARQEDLLLSPMPFSSSPNDSDVSSKHPMYYLGGPPGASDGHSGSRPGYSAVDLSSGRSRSASIRSGARGSTSSGSGVTMAAAGLMVTGDNVTLFEWTAPAPTMSVSQLSEGEQMLALRKYVAGLESEMEVHQEHRIPMTRLFLPKSNNFAKAFNNWERRSRHLLKEMVKYQIYVECLEQSIQFLQQQELELDQALRLVPQDPSDILQQLRVPQDDRQEHTLGHARSEKDVEAELALLVVHEEPE